MHWHTGWAGKEWFRAVLNWTASRVIRDLQASSQKLASVLGPVQAGSPRVLSAGRHGEDDGLAVEQVVLETEPGILVPLLILKSDQDKTPRPVVLGLSQSGKAGFLRERSTTLAQLVKGGAAVCLPDLRGTGETRSWDRPRP